MPMKNIREKYNKENLYIILWYESNCVPPEWLINIPSNWCCCHYSSAQHIHKFKAQSKKKKKTRIVDWIEQTSIFSSTRHNNNPIQYILYYTGEREKKKHIMYLKKKSNKKHPQNRTDGAICLNVIGKW